MVSVWYKVRDVSSLSVYGHHWSYGQFKEIHCGGMKSEDTVRNAKGEGTFPAFN